MMAVLLAARFIVTAAIVGLVGISFFPREGASRLTRLQKVLTNTIEQRRK